MLLKIHEVAGISSHTKSLDEGSEILGENSRATPEKVLMVQSVTPDKTVNPEGWASKGNSIEEVSSVKDEYLSA